MNCLIADAISMKIICPACHQATIPWLRAANAGSRLPAICSRCGARSIAARVPSLVLELLLSIGALVAAIASFRLWSWYPIAAFVIVVLIADYLVARHFPLELAPGAD
jgi:hypothetical protein